MLARFCVSLTDQIDLITVNNSLRIIPVGKAGLGKDIWTIKFEDITRILYVCSSHLRKC